MLSEDSFDKGGSEKLNLGVKLVSNLFTKANPDTLL